MSNPAAIRKNGAWGHWLISAPTILFLLTLLIHFFPGLGTLLEFDRQAILAGQYWRFLTGNWTHWTASHLFWDLLMFSALGMMIYRQDPRTYWRLTLVGATSVAITVWVFSPHMVFYRGLSGIDCAFYAYLVSRFTLMAARQQQRQLFAAGVILQLLVIGKTVFELVSGSTLFVESADFVPLVSTHLAGIAVGSLFAIIKTEFQNTCPTGNERKVPGPASAG